MYRWMLLIVCGLVLSGCATTYPYTRNPSLETGAWTRDVHQCKLVAREGFVFGSALFVMAEYNTRWKVCMVHRGWFIPRPKDGETQAALPQSPTRPPVQIATRAEYCRQLGEVAWGFGINRNFGIPLSAVMDSITNLPVVENEIPGYRDTYRRIAVLVYNTPEHLPEALWRLVETDCLQEAGTRS